MLNLYLDQNVHEQIRLGLRRRGVDCLTARDDGRHRAGDPAILERATVLARVLVTHDDDFLIIAAEWNRQARPFSGIIFAHMMRVTVGQAIEDTALIAHAVPADEIRSSVMHLPL